MNESIGIAGTGRVAQAFGRVLLEAGQPVVCIAGRDLERARAAAQFIGPGIRPAIYSDLPGVARWLIAVADAGLPEVAAILADRSAPAVALHTCGNRGPEVLAPLAARAVACGTVHPFQTVTGGTRGVAALRGASFAVWGDPAAVAWAEQIATLAGGEVLRIPPGLRPFYHAAAVMASNYAMALLDAAQTLLRHAGVEPGAALRALSPILRTAVSNALERGPLEALTGPIERGDVETVAAHLRALTEVPETVQLLYRAAGLHALDLARRRGLGDPAAGRLQQILSRD